MGFCAREDITAQYIQAYFLAPGFLHCCSRLLAMENASFSYLLPLVVQKRSVRNSFAHWQYFELLRSMIFYGLFTKRAQVLKNLNFRTCVFLSLVNSSQYSRDQNTVTAT